MGRIDEARFCRLLEDILRLEDQGLPAAERQRNITAAILYGSYILQSFYAAANHVGCLHSLTLLYAAILCAAERYELDRKKYRQSLDLLDREIARLGALLEEELVRGGLQVMQNPVWDGDLGVFRRQLAVDYFVAYKLHQLLQGDQGWRSTDVEAVLEWIRIATVFWGEGATPGYALRFWLLSCLDPARRHDFTEFLYTPLAIVARANGRRAEDGVASPYYRQEFVLRVQYGIENAGFDESFAGRAYTAWPLVELLARYNRRDVLTELWRDLTYISNVDFVAATPSDVFRWRNAIGREDSSFPPQTQSQAELREQSVSIDDGRIPESLRARIHFAPLFLLTFPHRFSKDLVKFADGSIRAVAP